MEEVIAELEEQLKYTEKGDKYSKQIKEALEILKEHVHNEEDEGC